MVAIKDDNPSPLQELEKRYEQCLRVEEDDFFDHYGSRFKKSLYIRIQEKKEDEAFASHGSRFKRESSIEEIPEIEPRALKEFIITVLFSQEYRCEPHWLETILHILKRENDQELLRIIIRNMAGINYGAFQGIYRALVKKEMNLLESEKTLAKNGAKSDCSSKEVLELQKLRRSMIMHLAETDVAEYRKKLSCCIESEPCLVLFEAILERIGKSQDAYELTLPESSWMKIESIHDFFDAYGLKEDSAVKKASDEIIVKRDLIRKKMRASCMKSNTAQIGKLDL